MPPHPPMLQTPLAMPLRAERVIRPLASASTHGLRSATEASHARGAIAKQSGGSDCPEVTPQSAGASIITPRTKVIYAYFPESQYILTFALTFQS